jgi:hypothetical protein
MIRINLLKSQKGSGLPPLVGRREAIFGATLLALACLGLFYLSQRSSRNATSPPKPAAARLEPESPPASLPVSAPEPAEPPAARATPAPPPPPAPVKASVNPAAGCRITAVSFETQPDGMLVRVQAAAAPQPKSFELDKPDRLVIDLPGCTLDLPREQYSQRVDHPPIARVRVNLFQESPPVVRLVLDLARKSRYQITPSPAGLDIRVPEASP